MDKSSTENQLRTVNSIDVAKVIEKLFALDLSALYTLPLHAQLQIIAFAARHSNTKGNHE